MWYNTISWFGKKEKLEEAIKREREQRINKLREILEPLRLQLQYLASYRTSQCRFLYREFN